MAKAVLTEIVRESTKSYDSESFWLLDPRLRDYFFCSFCPIKCSESSQLYKTARRVRKSTEWRRAVCSKSSRLAEGVFVVCRVGCPCLISLPFPCGS